ncbi:g77 [Coccomyxa viridis]|uniref:G77 protein n=1 Tax=Coccomyxa viridis TaxID=1274662 RepID=A0ABP1FLG9_9CHLO
MARGDDISVKYEEHKRPLAVFEGDSRLDGRGYEMFRSVFMKTGTLSKAAGSAYAEFGNSKVMAGVYGPRESDRRETFSEEGRLRCDIKFATFSRHTRKSNFSQTDEEKDMSSQMLAALEAAVLAHTFPKSNVDVYCLVLESGGSDLAVCVSAASLALADGGIEMRDLVSACRVSRVEGHLLLDPTENEAYREDGGLLLAYMPQANLVGQVVMTGEWDNEDAKEVLQLGMGGCAQIDAYMRQCLREALSGDSMDE